MTDDTHNISGQQLDRYAVVGNPIAHSRSPEIHQAFAAQLGEQIIYEKVAVEPGRFAAFADDFAAAGGCGMNVTVPFKGDAFRYAEQTDELAAGAGAVNTLVFRRGQSSWGYNTDGVGLIRDLVTRYGVGLKGRNILLLGAGGAASGVIQPLLAEGPNKLIVANRTAANAQALVASHRSRLNIRVQFQAAGLSELEGSFDLVINATSSGLSGGAALIEPRFVKGAFCYDMSYGAAAVFARWSRDCGAEHGVDGLGMLVEQAAQSYFLWRGKRPRTDPVVAQLRTSM